MPRHLFERNNLTENVVISREALVVCSIVNLAGCISGAACNILVIMTIAMTKKLYNSSINRAVLTLCLADLFAVLVDVPLTTTLLIGNHLSYMVWQNHKHHNHLFHFNTFDFILIRI